MTFSTTLLTWSNANVECRSFVNAYGLATIPDATTNTYLTSLISSNAYVGGTKATTGWAWIVPSVSWSYNNWNDNFPDSSSTKTSLVLTTSGKWENYDGFTGLEYICEADPA